MKKKIILTILINVSYEYEKNERIMLSYFYANIEKMCEKRNLYEI